MRINVAVTLDIDPEAWAIEYGVEGAAAIRADVKMHAINALKQHYDNIGVLGEWSPA